MGTSPTQDWYEVTTGPSLLQGDVIRDCPILTASTASILSAVPEESGESEQEDAESPESGGDELEVETDLEVRDVCVLTQSCDLENDKVAEVLVGHLLPWKAAVKLLVAQKNESAKSTRFREALVAGNVPGLALLRKRTEPPAMDWSVVDFHRLQVVRKDLLEAVAQRNGERLRLVSPYREHLGQEFARYHMRVALPLHAKDFVSEGAG